VVTISAEGPHTLDFFSIDRAGNREEVKTIIFTIDKTPPEAVIQFDPAKKDLTFAGLDNLSAPEDIVIADADDTVTLTDQAGNNTELKLKDKNRKILLQAEIKSLSYNNQPADLGKNKLSFLWLYDKKGNLNLLTQNVQNRKNYNILATYAGKNTLLVGIDQNGRISRTLNGLVLLKIATSKGDLAWGY
jgi:arginine repressor